MSLPKGMYLFSLASSTTHLILHTTIVIYTPTIATIAKNCSEPFREPPQYGKSQNVSFLGFRGHGNLQFHGQSVELTWHGRDMQCPTNRWYTVYDYTTARIIGWERGFSWGLVRLGRPMVYNWVERDAVYCHGKIMVEMQMLFKPLIQHGLPVSTTQKIQYIKPPRRLLRNHSSQSPSQRRQILLVRVVSVLRTLHEKVHFCQDGRDHWNGPRYQITTAKELINPPPERMERLFIELKPSFPS